MSYYARLIDALGPRPNSGSPLGPKPTDMRSRVREAQRLTRLLEAERSFSFIRLGDMELVMLLAMQDGNDDPFGQANAVGVNGTAAYGTPGIGMKYAPRITEAFCKADYVDFHQRLWPISALLPGLQLERRQDGHSNPDAETSYILLTWLEMEFASYCARHRVGFAGAEASLLECLSADHRFREIASEYWPPDESHFHQVRNDGRDLDDNLDRIKEDLRQFIQQSNIDTLFLSLGGAAKILCHELAIECGIRMIDFGAMLRALTYSGSDGQSATRATHSPFYYRVPFDIYMSALIKAFPHMPPEVILAKAHAQIIRELQPMEVGWTSAGIEAAPNQKNMERFRDSFSHYHRMCRPLFRANEKCQLERKRFLHFCGSLGLSWEGKTFYLAIRAKSWMTQRCRGERKSPV